MRAHTSPTSRLYEPLRDDERLPFTDEQAGIAARVLDDIAARRARRRTASKTSGPDLPR